MSDFFRQHAARMQSSKRATQRKVAAALEMVTGLPGAARDALAKVANDANWGFLNDAGRKDARMKAMESPFGALTRAKLESRRLRESLAEAMPKLPALAKDDIVGFLADQEARAYVRSLPQEKRDRIERLAPELAGAVARAAPELSGVSPSVHAMLRDQLAEQSNPEEVAGLREDREALDWLDEAARQAEKTLVESMGFLNDHGRRQYVERIEKPIVEEFEANDETRRAADNTETMENLFLHYTQAPYAERSAMIDRLLAVQVDDVKAR